MMTKRFEVGQTYATPSYCGYKCIFTILRRTEKTLTMKVDDRMVRRKVSIFNGSEEFKFVKPFGNYSMTAIINATDLVDSAA